MYAYTHTHVCTCIYTYIIRMYMPTFIRTYIYTYTHIYEDNCVNKLYITHDLVYIICELCFGIFVMTYEY
jgi:hypothetical protein